MPLVTRQANQGNLFNTPTEPPDWIDGDLWSDTTANIVKFNLSGTATNIGILIAEQETTPVTDDSASTIGDTNRYGNTPTTIGSVDDGKFYFVSAVEWKNSTDLSDTVTAGVWGVDNVSPSAAAAYLVGQATETAQSGSGVVQKVQVSYSRVFPGGTIIMGWIKGTNAGGTFRYDVLASINRRKTYASDTTLDLKNTNAWSGEVNTFYVKVYYQEVG